MRIAALMPLKIDEEKTRIAEAARQAREVADEFIILFDRGQDVLPIKCTESVQVRGGDGVWSDWANRATLLVRAAKYGCDWVMWLDDDETLGPSLTRERVRQICLDAEVNGQVLTSIKVKTAWDETHWRSDGIFGGQNKPLFQKNPMMLKNPVFHHTSSELLHRFPRLEGQEGLILPDFIVHWGLRSRALREKNARKYQAADPNQLYSNISYDYLLSETNLTLEPL